MLNMENRFDKIKSWFTDPPLIVLTLLVFFLPLYRSGFFEDSYNTPKLLLLSCSLLLLWATIIRYQIVNVSPRLRILPPLWFGLFVLWNALSAFWALSPGMVMLPFMVWLCLLLLYTACINILKEPRAVFVLFGGMVAAACLTAIWTVIDDLTAGKVAEYVTRLPDWRGYLSAGLGNSGHIAGLMGYVLPGAVLIFLGRERFDYVLFIAILVMAPAFVITWSVGSSGSALLSLALWTLAILVTGNARRFRWQRLVPLALVGIATACFLLFPHALNHHANGLWNEAFSSNRWHEGWPTRIAIWKTTWHILSSSPIVGVGAGNFTYAFTLQIVPSLQASPDLAVWAGSFTNEAHNEILQITAELGLVGLTLVALVLFAYFRDLQAVFSVDDKPDWHAAALISGTAMTAFLLDSLMTFPLRLPAHAAWCVIFLAIPTALVAARKEVTYVNMPWLTRTPLQKWAFIILMFIVFPALLIMTIGRRSAAELIFKHGRMIAEMPLETPNGQGVNLWDEGVKSVDAAMDALSKGDIEAMKYNMGKAHYYADQNTMKLACDSFIRAAKIDSTYSNVASRLSLWYLMHGDFIAAENEFNNTYRYLSAYEVPLRLGFTEYLLGDLEEAHKYWQTVVDRKPSVRRFAMELIAQTPATTTTAEMK